MRNDLLKEAIERLADTKQEIIDKIDSYEAEIRRYKESNKELEDNFTIEVNNEKTEKWTKSLQAGKKVKETLEGLKEVFSRQREIVKTILEYNTNFGNLDQFFDLVLLIDGLDTQFLYETCCDTSKVTKIVFPYKASDITRFNEKRISVLMKVDLMLQEKAIYGHSISNKQSLALEVKGMLNSLKFIDFYDTFIKYFNSNLKEVDKIAKDNGKKLQEVRENEIAKRKEEINNNIREINRKIDECKKSLVSIGEIYTLYDEYKKTESQDTLIEITTKLADLVVISQRESKMITHDEKEKATKKVETVAPVKVEVDHKPLQIKQVIDPGFFPEEESDYFTWDTTEKIICFLGPDDDTIIDDINNEFDKSARPIVSAKLVDLFEQLRNQNENKKEQGGNPHQGTTRKVLALLGNPFHFNYRRYGTGRDPYRIHAIERHSDLLKDLHFGKGNIIFFGSAGLNVEENKADSYNRLGRRAIKELTVPITLRTNFDYIEHITRDYIPLELLSDSDKEKYSLGRFDQKMKGGKSKTIESKYIHYKALDQKTMTNVHNWLFDYFVKQTSMMVDIYKVNKELKGNTIG